MAKGFIVTLKLLGLLFQVRDVILDLSLSPSRQPPIVCIDESQVTFWQQIHIPPSCEIFFCPHLPNLSKKCPSKVDQAGFVVMAPPHTAQLPDMTGLQVLDSELGWESFRKDYGAHTWQWLTAATKPRSSIELEVM